MLFLVLTLNTDLPSHTKKAKLPIALLPSATGILIVRFKLCFKEVLIYVKCSTGSQDNT